MMKKKLIKIEKGSEKGLGAFVILISLMLIFTSLGKTTWLMYISGAFSLVLGTLFYFEGGVRDYLKKKKYKSIDGNDLIVWSAFVFGTFLIINGIMIFLGNMANGGFFNFIRSSGIIGGALAGILGIILVFTPKPKA